MKLFMVERWGVYQQGTFGAYTSLDLANEAMARAKALESDDYHTFRVEEIETDADQWSEEQ